MNRRITSEDIGNLIESQFEVWPEVAAGYDNLRYVERRPLPLGDLEAAVQFNPARIRSTAAKVDAASLAARPCFLCEANRPAEQIVTEWPDGWHLLVNPYPILPVHFTIVDRNHVPQAGIPLDMAAMADMAPDLVFFFNGAQAGASAPDHRHVQAVLKEELPLMRLVEKMHPADRPGWMSSDASGLDLPFHFLSAVVTPDGAGRRALAKCLGAYGTDSATGEPRQGLVNAFMWIDAAGLLRIVIVPRRAHRPSLYFKPDEERMMVSPGAIDMAGIMIFPRREDFERISSADVRKIYSEVAYSDSLPGPLKEFFLG